MTQVYYKRGFLNEADGIAAYEAEITSWNGEKSYDATFSISDCNRRITLDFSCWSVDGKTPKVNYYKLDMLIAELMEFKEKLMEVDLEA